MNASVCRTWQSLIVLGLLVISAVAVAAEPGVGYTYLGKIRPRHAREIQSSNWSVGAETMDRDYTVYANWKKYLGPLGVKKARIQAGWAKTEQEPGKYDWTWLDEIIPDMVDQGVEPWVCLCYGNPIYPGGGGTGLSGGLPSSAEALAAWDAFVAAFVDRYKEHVDEWEIWNEPRGGQKAVPQYADLVVRTAEAIRQRQPESRIIVAAGGAFDTKFVESLLGWLKAKGSLDLVNEVTYHPYATNPDSIHDRVRQLRDAVARYSTEITLRQGENGAPSKRGSFGALANYDWTEERQAKWALRRLLGDLGRDIPSSYFAICDMVYLVTNKGRDSDLRDASSELQTKINYKGLLAVDPDKTVDHAKTAYQAVQHVTAIFDDSLKRIEDYTCEVTGGAEESSYSVFGYHASGGKQIVTLWRDSDPPGERPELDRVSLSIRHGGFADPVLVDMLSGKVYGISRSLWTESDKVLTFTSVPVYDAVILIAERSAIPAGLIRDPK